MQPCRERRDSTAGATTTGAKRSEADVRSSSEHHHDEHVRRYAERHSRVAHAAQVHEHEQRHAPMHIATACGASAGYADVIAAIPPEIDTDTVRM